MTDFDSAKTSDTTQYARFFHHLPDHGIYLPPSQFESWFLSILIQRREIDQILNAIDHY